MDLLESFAHSLTGDPQISVVMKGQGCFVDLKRKRINIPAVAVPDNTQVPPFLIGYLDHEVGHLLNSTQEAIEKVINAFASTSQYEQAVAKYVHNILDDCRQEPLFLQRYPGGRYYLGAAAVHDLKKTLEAEAMICGKGQEAQGQQQGERVAPNKALADPRILAAIAYLHTFAITFYDTGLPMPASVTKKAIRLAGEYFPEYAALTALSPMEVADLCIKFLRENPWTPPKPPEPQTGQQPGQGQGKPRKGRKGEQEEAGGGPPSPGDFEDEDDEAGDEDEGQKSKSGSKSKAKSKAKAESEESEEDEDGDGGAEGDEDDEESEESEKKSGSKSKSDDESEEDEAEGEDEGDEDGDSDSDGDSGSDGAGDSDGERSESEENDSEDGDGKPAKNPEDNPMSHQGGGGKSDVEQDLEAIEFLKQLGHDGKKEEFDKTINELAGQALKRQPNTVYPPFTTEFDKVVEYTKLANAALSRNPAIAKEVAVSTAAFDATTSNVLGAVQRKFLGAHKRRKIVRDDDGFEFSDDAFVSVAAKDFRGLFHDRDNTRSIKGTAVTLGLDLSGSMSDGTSLLFGERTLAAVSAVWSVWAIASILRCPFEIIGYTTVQPGYGSDDKARASMDGRGFGPYRRSEGVVTHIIKSFDEKWGQQHKNALVMLLGSIRYNYCGYIPVRLKVPACGQLATSDLALVWNANCDGENLAIMRERLARRGEQRKVLIMVSDGNPVCHIFPREHIQDHLRYEIRRTAQRGIKIVGVGIGGRGAYVKDFYPINRHVPDPSGLGPALLEIL